MPFNRIISVLAGNLIAVHFVLYVGCVNMAMPGDNGTSTSGGTSTGNAPARGLFSADSPWNTPIPENPVIDPASPLLIQRFVQEYAKIDGFQISVDTWSDTVFWADADTPRYDVPLTAEWPTVDAHTFLQVPIPDGAVPDPEDDGHMTIVHEASGFMYEFWQAKKIDGAWIASWGNRIPIGGSGFYPGALSCRGAGVAILAGMIWPEELDAGEIHHALAFSYTFNRSGGPVAPATESDGLIDDPAALPEGARLQLDPTLDLDALELTPWEMAIARAMQDYGMINIDRSGSIELEVINPLSFEQDPYVNTVRTVDAGWNALPAASFRVLEMGPQNPNIVEYLPDPSSHSPD